MKAKSCKSDEADYSLVSLIYNIYIRYGLDAHLLDKPACTAHFVDSEQYVADVADDVTAESLIELDVAHCREPSTVEVYADKLALAIEDWRT